MLHNVAEDVRVVLIKLADRIQGKYTDKISTYRAAWQR
jgi:(p)ppGpp synthase/HD superfamily hydrolase